MAGLRRVYYSYHYEKDVFRFQQIRNIKAFYGNNPVSSAAWEIVRKDGDSAIKKWIDDNMKNKSCVVVLIGEETDKRPWIKYEIEKAWKEGKGLLGIHVNNLKDPKTGKCSKGKNPFDRIKFRDKSGNIKTIPCKSPSSVDPYNDIKNNIKSWIEEAIKNNS